MALLSNITAGASNLRGRISSGLFGRSPKTPVRVSDPIVSHLHGVGRMFHYPTNAPRRAIPATFHPHLKSQNINE